LIIESLLGLRLDVDKLHFSPCLPADWPGFTMHYRYRETVYHITVRQEGSASTAMEVRVDGSELEDTAIPLIDDHKEHWVEVKVRPRGN
jgi:cellobiose phosphorylase